jgi:hypothetical protein
MVGLLFGHGLLQRIMKGGAVFHGKNRYRAGIKSALNLLPTGP